MISPGIVSRRCVPRGAWGKCFWQYRRTVDSDTLPTSAHYHFLSWKLDSAGLHDNITSTIDYLENNNGEAEFIPVPSGGHIFEFNNTDAEVIQILENLVIAVSEDLNA
jgi:hypothetical protein